MLRLRGRLARLEKTLAPAHAPRKHVRWLFRGICGTADLATSFCRRWIAADGTLWESVTLDVCREGLTDERLEKFIESFPIETGQQRGWS